jgi:hypothetical protein
MEDKEFIGTIKLKTSGKPVEIFTFLSLNVGENAIFLSSTEESSICH